MLCVLRLGFGGHRNRDGIRLIVIAGEEPAVVDLLQLHAVVVDYAVGRDRAAAAFDELPCGSLAVQREPVLHDDRVFLRSDEESRPGFAVDLMLDASASRLHCQEAIAIQGYILAKSLASCGIPVRVTSFCSLRGYTVLRILKDFGDKNGERNVFNYFAAGWNRDGLALRGAGELIKSAPAEKHLLILLTDASPDDSHKILPSGKVPLSRDYDGQIGVDDTAEEVRALRAQGIRVAAVFMGENASVPAANAIYGRDLARIRRIDQLAATAGRLIQDEIRELSG